jgi:hypothetical protein
MLSYPVEQWKGFSLFCCSPLVMVAVTVMPGDVSYGYAVAKVIKPEAAILRARVIQPRPHARKVAKLRTDERAASQCDALSAWRGLASCQMAVAV